MTGKRKSTSRNPKTVKCSKLQTNSIKKSVINEEEKVQLDFLVVEKIASMTKLKFAPDICLELVSCAFAKALRSFYSKKKVTLSFALSAEDAEYAYSVKGYPGIFVLFISGFTRQSKEKIKIDDDNLGQAAQQIFARFRRIHLKEEEVINSDNAAGSLTDALNSVHDVTIKTLHITFCYRNLIESFELIMKLSRNLKNLNLHILDPSDRDVEWSENFWQTVASCTKLVWLNVEFDYDRCVEDNPLETSDAILVPISNCLKQLKIKHFRTNLQEGKEGRRTMEWLPRALAKNENLRHLDIDTCFESGCYLGDITNVENGPLVLSRLESLKIRITDWVKHRKDWVSSFEKILLAMSNHAILKISMEFCKDIERVLQMYVNLSHRTARSIKLRLLFWKDDVDAIARFDRALHQLSSMKEFRDLKMIPCGEWTRLLFGNANLMVKALHGSV